MKINELFEPQSIPVSFDSNFTLYDQTIQFIKEKCSNIILEYKNTNKVLYRGFGEFIEKDIFIAQSPENRIPVDSHETASKLYDIS